MKKSTFSVHPKASISLMSQVEEPQSEASLGVRRMLSAVRRVAPEAGRKPIALILESAEAQDKPVERHLQDLRNDESAEHLSKGFYSLRIHPDRVAGLLDAGDVRRLQTKKPSRLHLEAALPEASVSAPLGARQVAETGQGVFIGIVDSGFDLSHPMFRDASGKLRVKALLDQNRDRTFTTARLEQGWASGSNPGADEDGHGTHVASIAGGSRFGNREGVAPDARFLLVKTNFEDTDKAVSWIFRQAGASPCVINMSLGHHFGSHDGTDAEERLHDVMSGPGKIVVISAGNEATDAIHLGTRFFEGQSRSATFDFLMPADGSAPGAPITLWYDAQDDFDIALLTPTGARIEVPAAGSPGQTFSASQMQIKVARSRYAFHNLIEAQIVVEFRQHSPGAAKLRGWSLRFKCTRAAVGRLDAWFANSGMAEFRPGAMVETSRTIGLAATGASCIAVASYVSKNSFDADDGTESDPSAVKGRISSFSSLGPSRDNREKPDIAAAGQYLTAALAAGSAEGDDGQVADTANRVLSIAGTSMAAPVVAGVVALLLQKRATLTPAQIKEALFSSARKDIHTGSMIWTPHYGHGKIDAARALQQV